jgi:hypothetical protein
VIGHEPAHPLAQRHVDLEADQEHQHADLGRRQAKHPAQALEGDVVDLRHLDPRPRHPIVLGQLLGEPREIGVALPVADIPELLAPDRGAQERVADPELIEQVIDGASVGRRGHPTTLRCGATAVHASRSLDPAPRPAEAAPRRPPGRSGGRSIRRCG